MSQLELNRAENMLSECLNSMGDASAILKLLREHDTFDKVFQQAYEAVNDAIDHAEDAISSVADGFGAEDSGD